MFLDNYQCTFCGNSESEHTVFIVDLNNALCRECIESCYYLIKHNEKKQLLETVIKKLKKPHEIKEYLDQYVIGQEDAKKTLAVAVYNHHKRMEIQELDNSVVLNKSNVMLFGSTGTGKTYLLQKIASYLDIPFIVTDATQYTETGYVGLDVNIMLKELYEAAGKNIEKAQKGIIYIDEIDKLAIGGRNISDRSVQQGLLRMIEGAVMEFPSKGVHLGGSQGGEHIKMDTKDILFIVGGAFTDIKEQIKARKKPTTVGFHANHDEYEENPYTAITNNDLIKFGLLSEFVGRFPVKTHLNDLTKEDLKRILLESKESPIVQYVTLLEFDKLKLKFSDKAIDKIADKMLELKVGARGNRTVIEGVLAQIMFDAPKDTTERELTIEEDMIK